MLHLIAHALSLQEIVNMIVGALHHHGTTNMNVDQAGQHRAWVETRHWLITIRWKG